MRKNCHYDSGLLNRQKNLNFSWKFGMYNFEPTIATCLIVLCFFFFSLQLLAAGNLPMEYKS